MRSAEDKGCYSYEIRTGGAAARKALGSRAKPAPSKWDDAQKWLVGLSAAASGGGGGGGGAKSKPRNSNADDRRLLGSLSQNGRSSCSSMENGGLEYNLILAAHAQDEGEMKRIDCPVQDPPLAIKSICLRDMGTEMTPIASKEPSRTGTPLRSSTPVMRSPVSSRSSTPARRRQEAIAAAGDRQSNAEIIDSKANENGCMNSEANAMQIIGRTSALESRAVAWDEAERAKYTARYKREEVKIQVWEDHEKRKAEMEMKRMEVKAERMKARAQEKLANKLSATRRIAEEKRANAEAKLTERAARTTERADYIRRTGHLPSSSLLSSLKLHSFCG